MEAPRIATVRPVEESQATGKVAEIFADIKRTKNIDFVPNLWRMLATNPAQLEAVWTALKTWMHPEAVGRTPRLDAADARDHRPGRLGHQRLRLLRQLAHRRAPQAGARCRRHRRSAGHCQPVQHDQHAGRRLPG